MYQKNDQLFVKLLNKVRVGEVEQDDKGILKSQFIEKTCICGKCSCQKTQRFEVKIYPGKTIRNKC